MPRQHQKFELDDQQFADLFREVKEELPSDIQLDESAIAALRKATNIYLNKVRGQFPSDIQFDESAIAALRKATNIYLNKVLRYNFFKRIMPKQKKRFELEDQQFDDLLRKVKEELPSDIQLDESVLATLKQATNTHLNKILDDTAAASAEKKNVEQAGTSSSPTENIENQS